MMALLLYVRSSARPSDQHRATLPLGRRYEIMNGNDKLRMAHQLDRLGVDVIEVGFRIASGGSAVRQPAIGDASGADCRHFP